MSTKAIREVLETFQKTNTWEMIENALEQVEAIEAIAKDWTSVNDEDRTEAQWQAHDALMRSIAKEAA